MVRGKFHCTFCGDWTGMRVGAPPMCDTCIKTNASVKLSDWIHWRNLNWRLRNKRIKETGNVYGKLEES